MRRSHLRLAGAVLAFVVLIGAGLWLGREDQAGVEASIVRLPHRTTSQATDPATHQWRPTLKVAPGSQTREPLLQLLTASQGPDAVPGDGLYSRQRTARLGSAMQAAAQSRQPSHGQRLELNLFADTTFVGTVNRHDILGPGRGVYYGSLDQAALGMFILAYDGDAMAAAVWAPEGDAPRRFEVRPTGDGSHVVGEIRESAVAPCGMGPDGPGVPARLALTPREQAAIAGKAAAKVEELAEAAELGGGAGVGVLITTPANQGSLTLVDVMILYTDDARAANGGTSGINAIVDLSVATANAAYANSGVNVEMRLVHRQEMAYTETGNLSTDLNALRNGTGELSSVPTLRNTHGADLVSLFVEAADSGGLGYSYSGSSTFGFSVVWAGNPADTFCHEAGHNQGCAHDREHASAGSAEFTYSYGWRTLIEGEVQIRTVMAYAPGFPIPFFSNPDLQLNGVPAGTPIGQPLEASNAATINATAAVVAGFRSAGANAPPTVAITQPTVGTSFGPIQPVTIDATAADAEGSVSRVDFYLINNNLSTVHLGTDTTPPYSITTSSLPAGEVRVSAVATDNLGASASSDRLLGVGAFYSIETIPPLSGYEADTTPTAINASGVVTGYGTASGGQTRAFVYANSAITDLGTLPGDVSSEGKAINAAGVVVGRSIAGGGTARAFRHTPGQGMIDLNSLITAPGGATIIDAVGISDAGHILLRTSSGTNRWYIWNGSTLTALQSPGNPANITGQGLSPSGIAVGYDFNFSVNPTRWQATTWSAAGVPTYLIDFGVSGFGRAVNDAGDVAGNFGNGTPTSAAFWSAGSPADLGTFGGDDGRATGINGYGEVVGYAEIATGPRRGFVRRDGVVRQAADLVADAHYNPSGRWVLETCAAINDAGHITGNGQLLLTDPDNNPSTNDADYVDRGFILHPTAGVDVRYWNAAQFTPAELLDPLVSGPQADPDHDGKPNLLERALNTDPRAFDAEHPVVDISEGLLTISFVQLKARNDLTYIVQVSTDLVTWTTVTTRLSRTSIDENSERVVMQAPAPGGTASRQFIRLLVQEP